MARLMIVDDHPVVRQGLTSFLAAQSDLEVAAEAGTLEEARAALRRVELDLVLLDLQLPDGSGLALLRELSSQEDPPRVLVLTSFLDGEDVRNAVAAGASGYLLKHAGTSALLDAIRSALRGELPLAPEAAKLLATYAERPLPQLTDRERQVLALLTRGLSNRDMAQRLGVREKTVKTHLGNIFAKLEVRDRTQAALWARDHGF